MKVVKKILLIPVIMLLVFLALPKNAEAGFITTETYYAYFHYNGGKLLIDQSSLEPLMSFVNGALKTEISYTPADKNSHITEDKANITIGNEFAWQYLIGKENYRFDGFYTGAGEPIYDENGKYVPGNYWTEDGKWKHRFNVHAYARWVPLSYDITYDLNYSGGGVTTENCLYDKDVVIKNVSRDGYYFLGWNTKADGTGDYYQGGKRVSNIGNITLYAQWQAPFTLTFNSNAEPDKVDGTMENMILMPNTWYSLPKNNFKKTTANGESTFLGWSTSKDGGAEITDTGSLKIFEDTILYAQWNDYPCFYYKEVPNRYYTLEEAANGDITEEDLLSTITVGDESGILKKYTRETYVPGTPGVTVVDYNPEEFKSFTKPGAVSVRYKAVDELGQTTYLDIMVYIQKNKAKNGNSHYVRSISKKYFDTKSKEAGGLKATSVWYMDENANIINQALSNNAPVTYHFSEEKIRSLKNYMDNSSNIKTSEALNALKDKMES